MPHMKSTSQQGAVLILSLIFLLALTLLGLSGMRTSTLEEKMSSNMRDMDLAFEAAESGLRESETWIDTRTSEPKLPSGFVYDVNGLPDLTSQNHTWWTSDANTGEYGVTGSSAVTGVHDQPRFVLQFRAFIPDSLVVGYDPSKGRNVYRATARGTGAAVAAETAQRMVQDTVVKRFN